MKTAIKKVKLNDLIPTENNPRQIKKDDFERLKKSIKSFPKMLDIREIVVDENNRILGGHQRVKALLANGETEVNVKVVEGLSEEEKREFVIRDNVQNGEWDFDVLANEWDKDELSEWGVELKEIQEKDYKSLLNVEIPTYEPSPIAPSLKELADLDDYDKLCVEIDKAVQDEKLKKLLKARAAFFVDFNFQKIADYYSAIEDEYEKELFEKLGLVIVVPKRAYELGMCDFTESLEDEE